MTGDCAVEVVRVGAEEAGELVLAAQPGRHAVASHRVLEHGGAAIIRARKP